MPRFHGHRAGFGHHHHHGMPFMGPIWMIGLGFLMFFGHWWPGIIILIGLSMIMSAFWRGTSQQTFDNIEPPVIPPARPVSHPSTPPVAPMPFTPPAPVVSTVHRTDLLPATCPHCGAPVRANDVKWMGTQSAACAYCGSTLPMKKSI